MKKKISILLILACMLICVWACSPKTLISSEEPTKGAGITDVQKEPTKAPTEALQDVTGDVTPGLTTETEPTKTPVTEAPTPTQEAVTPEPTPSLTPTPEPEPTAVDDERLVWWNDTFLIWLPMFEKGVFFEHSAADTFDYISFTGVSTDDVTEYIEALDAAGLNVNADYGNENGKLWYYAGNSENWQVTLDYMDGILKIGSGFFAEDEEDVDAQTERLWHETMLAYIPKYSAGSFEYADESAVEGGYTYITYSDVSMQDARDYAETLRALGYIYDEDSGDVDGVIWYMAMNEDAISCYMAYEDGIMILGCGYAEE